MVILPIYMVFKIVIVQGVVMAKNIWKAMVDFVDRHPSIFTAVIVCLLLFAVFVTGINRGYVEIIRTGTEPPPPYYSKVADVTLNPFMAVMYGDDLRIGVGMELGYVRPLSFSLIASVPMLKDFDKDRIAGGIGIDTQARENLFIGVSYNQEISGKDFWAVYGKVIF